MTLFNLQNQVLVKMLALITMTVMVASLMPASVFAQDINSDTQAGQVDDQKIPDPVNDPDENKDKQSVEKNFELTSSSSDFQNLTVEGELENAGLRIQLPKVWICHANNSNENASNQFTYLNLGLVPLLGHVTQHGDDIIPAYGLYAGKNLSTVYPEFGGVTGQEILDNECEIPYKETNNLIKITQSTVNLLTNPTGTGWYFESAALFVAPFIFNTSAPKIGTGSLFVGPVGAVPQNKFIGAYQNITPVKNFKSISYDFQIESNTAADENEFYLNIYANFGSSSPSKFYDCRYDVVPSTGSLSGFTTVIFDSTQSYSVTTRTDSVSTPSINEASPFACPATLAGMEALSPGSVVRAIALNVGDTGVQDTGVSGYFDNVIIKTQDDEAYTKNTTTFDFDPSKKKEEVTVVATKLVCDNESALPNWGAGGPDVTATTAEKFVSEGKCKYQKDWKFQWADQNAPEVAGNFIGESPQYTSFANPTDINGKTTQVISVTNVSEIKLREVLQNGYLPFSGNQDTVSAEFYCGDDVLNYDNYDIIRNLEAGKTYHCVAWNVLKDKPQETVKVHIYKYLATGNTITQVPNDSIAPSFPMISSWDAANLGDPASGSYVLGNNEGGTVLRYAADTSAMSVPADYTTTEVTSGDSVVLPIGAQCTEGKYRLLGYKEGTSFASAETAALTATAPNYVNITSDRYIIVVNEKCGDTPKPVCAVGQNLLQNGSFETTPVVTANGGQWEIFAGGVMNWLATMSSGLEVWRNFNGTGAGLASDGVQNVELDGDDATRITQTVTTIPGATYELTFDFSPRATIGAADNVLDALVNGSTILTVNGDGSANTANVWTPNAKTFVATGTSTAIGFEDKGVANAGGGYGPLLDNVALCLVREPEPEPVCTLTIKSDATDYVVEKNVSASLITFIHPSWVTTLGTSTAKWIWGDNPVVDATVAETQTFKKGFNWTGGTPTSATLRVSSDNTHAVTLGAFSGVDNTEFNYGPLDITTYAIPAANIATGANMLQIAVGNIPVLNGTATTNPAGLMYELTITGTGKSCGQVVPEVPKTTGTVTMCKVDKNNLPLSGWTMTLLGNKVEDVVVPATNAIGVNTLATLNANKSYVAKASGTWKNDRTPSPINMVDAEYSTENTWTTHMDGFGSDAKILELLINGSDDPNSSWGTYNGLHTYAQMFTQTATGSAKFNIYDTDYRDNSGSLNVAVYEGYAGITGENGCVTFKNVPYGTYDAGEIIKDGWTNISGTGSTVVNFVNTPKTITIKNDKKEIVINPDPEPVPVPTFTISGFKWNDVDGDGTYDEGETKLSNWAIQAINGTTTLATTTDANGNYSFKVPVGTWTVSEITQSGWTQSGLYKNGNKITLGTEVAKSCTQNVNIESLTLTCDFGNKQNPVVIVEQETPSPTSRSGGGGSSTRIKKSAPTGLVLGAATSTPACGRYLNDYMRMGNAASSTQVTKLQIFLNAVGITLAVTGTFDAATDAAVRTFQMSHKAEVLTPWYLAKIVPHENPTGWVYQLTRWKINNIVCPGSEAYPVLN